MLFPEGDSRGRTWKWSTLEEKLGRVKNNKDESERTFHSLNRMGAAWRWLGLCALAALVAPFGGANRCMEGIDVNVILLDDENFPWGLQYVKGEVLKAMEEDKRIGEEEGRT